ncbi:MAG: threonylcarbamoyl-AMP synthase [Candidatus Aminicenantes bacterium]|nr:threonylcarbamoyl-AMP synthase [Candidatus Aminicenantes bacterium]
MDIIKFENILHRDNLELIENTIKNDGVIVYPTDTLYGMGGNFFSLKVMKKIDWLKGRADMPYSAAVTGYDMIKKLTAEIPPAFYELQEKIFPGKFTALFKVSESINKALLKGSDKIGIRIPDIPEIIKLLEYLEERLDAPLISTSVNKSGRPPLRDPEQIKKEFPGIDLLIDAGMLPGSKGSTILDFTASPVKVTRKGDDFEKIENYFR